MIFSTQPPCVRIKTDESVGLEDPLVLRVQHGQQSIAIILQVERGACSSSLHEQLMH